MSDVDNNENLVSEQKACLLREKFESFMNKHSDDESLIEAVKSALDDNGLLPVKEIKKDYELNANNERLLKIGIVGAVKAGKSSFLNALLFDGKDILPKAATPMTAALTELQYGDSCEVKVEFFTSEDIQKLKEKSLIYEHKLRDLKEIKLQEQRNNWLKRKKVIGQFIKIEPTPEEEQRFEAYAERSALNEVNNDLSLSGSYQQYQNIKNANVPPVFEPVTLNVSSIDDIAGKLENYVGSNGQYMPFTSKVTIKLPLEKLKGLCVIDTPGFNDPVPSRDEKARRALKKCDVVYILSPSRQFLSKSDEDAISRITNKEGIRELYLIASQIDNQLYNMEYVQKFPNDLNAVLDSIKNSLKDAAVKNLNEWNSDGILTTLTSEIDNRLFLISGMCESLNKTFSERSSWDCSRQQVWKNLSKYYPNNFSDQDPDTSLNSLSTVSNIAPLYDCINAVKSKKKEIFHEKLEGLLTKYNLAAENTKKYIKQFIERKENTIENKSVKELENQIQNTKKYCVVMSDEINAIVLDCINDWYLSVCQQIIDELGAAKTEVTSTVQDSNGTESRRRHKTGFWSAVRSFFGSDETYTVEVSTFNISKAKSGLDDYIDWYNDQFPIFIQHEIIGLSKKISLETFKIWYKYSKKFEINGDDSFSGDILKNKVRSVLNSLKLQYDIVYKGEKFDFSNYGCGTISGSCAERCNDRLYDFISTLNTDLKAELTNIVNDISEKIHKTDFGENIINGYLNTLKQQEDELNNKKVVLNNIKRIQQELDVILETE